MIHYTPEGAISRIGLNWYLRFRPYFAVSIAWLWFDNVAKETYGWRIYFRWLHGRFRLSCAIIPRQDIVAMTLWEKDLVAIPRQLAEQSKDDQQRNQAARL